MYLSFQFQMSKKERETCKFKMDFQKSFFWGGGGGGGEGVLIRVMLTCRSENSRREK